jgi:hypothetical protein
VGYHHHHDPAPKRGEHGEPLDQQLACLSHEIEGTGYEHGTFRPGFGPCHVEGELDVLGHQDRAVD